MSLRFRCHPAHAERLPKPIPAREGLPGWLKAAPSSAFSAVLGAEVRTVKQCPPFLDAMGYGALMPLVADLTIEDGVFRWSSDLPPDPDAPGRSPIGAHAPEQATGAPFAPTGAFVIKFMNYWAIEVPEGWSLWAQHPANRLDLPFRTLTGMTSCDRFGLGLVHFPALWVDPGFSGTLPKGTPVAQVFAAPRAADALDIGVLSEAEAAEQSALRQALQATPGVYRKQYR